MHHASFGRFPAGVATHTGKKGGKYGYAWSVMLLPYVEQQAIYDQTNIAETNCSSLLNVRTDDDTFYSEHPGIVQFVYSDGSVHTVSENIDIGTLVLLGTRNDGLTQASIDCANTAAGALGGG